VNVEFWQAFVPTIRARAAQSGIGNFYVFGEVATSGLDVAQLARYTRVARLPAVLDFAFAYAVRATTAGNAGTDVLARLFADDPLYEGGEQTALQLPTFISNHDMGRFAWFVRVDRPRANDDEVLKRVSLAHAMLMTLRGVPVIYYGDEQGFAGTGGDQDARQDMFASQVPSYVADRRIGTVRATFDRNHQLYRTIAALSALRAAHPALRGGRQIVRNYSDAPGLFAVSRIDPASGREIVIAFNTGTEVLRTFVEIDHKSRSFTALHGECPVAPVAPGSYAITLPPLDFIVCAAAESPSGRTTRTSGDRE
jgi:glycosidase